MAIKQKLTGVGVPPHAAIATVGTVSNNISAAGTTQATATALDLNDYQIVTVVAASSGVILPATLSAGDEIAVANYDASGGDALSVYPPVGGKINNGTLNAAVSITANKNGTFVCIDSLNFIGKLSA